MADVTKTIGTSSRNYSTITAWEADLDNGAVYSSGDNAIGECYNDSVFDEAVTINGGGTVGLSSVRLTVPSSQRHSGTSGTGVRCVWTADERTLHLTPTASGPNYVAEWLEWNANNNRPVSGGAIIRAVGNTGVTAYFRNMLVRNAHTTLSGNVYGVLLDDLTGGILNSIVYDVTRAGSGVSDVIAGIALVTGTRATVCYNNTVASIDLQSSDGFVYGIYCDANDADYTIKNTIAMNVFGGLVNPPKDFQYQGTTTVASNNMSEDDTADDGSGSGHLINKTYSSQFISTTAGSENFHLKSTSDAIDVGTDLGTTPTGVNLDIDGRDRDASGDVWDIGADEQATLTTNIVGLTIKGQVENCTVSQQPSSLGFGKSRFKGKTNSGWPENLFNLGYYRFPEQSGRFIFSDNLASSGTFSNTINRYNFHRKRTPHDRTLQGFDTNDEHYDNIVEVRNNRQCDMHGLSSLATSDFTAYFKIAATSGIFNKGLIFNIGNNDGRCMLHIERVANYDITFEYKDIFGIKRSVTRAAEPYPGYIICSMKTAGVSGQLALGTWRETLRGTTDDFNFSTSDWFEFVGTSNNNISLGGSDSTYNDIDIGLSGHNFYVSEMGFSSSGWIGGFDVWNDFLHTRNRNYPFLLDSSGVPSVNDGNYVQWILASGTNLVEDKIRYQVNLPDAYEISGPVRSFYDNANIAPSAMYLELYAENNIQHPSGLIVDATLTYTKSGNPNFKMWRMQSSVPSGSLQRRVIGPLIEQNVNSGWYHPVRVGELSSALLDLNFSFPSSTSLYQGDLKIYSASIITDAWCEFSNSSGTTNLMTFGDFASVNNNFNLYLLSIPEPANTNLFIHGKSVHSGDLTLFIANNYVNSNIPLFVHGDSPLNSNIPLYIESALTSSSSGLYPSGMPLFIEGIFKQNADMPLFVLTKTPVPISGTQQLFTFSASTDTIYKTTNLVLKGNQQFAPQNVLPFVMGAATFDDITSNMNLFIANNNDVDKSVNLYISAPSGSNNNVNLFMASPSGTDGAVPLNADMPLFIQRSSEGVAHRVNLFTKVPEQSTNNFNMFVEGKPDDINNNIVLWISGKQVPNNNTKLYTHGK